MTRSGRDTRRHHAKPTDELSPASTNHVDRATGEEPIAGPTPEQDDESLGEPPAIEPDENEPPIKRSDGQVYGG